MTNRGSQIVIYQLVKNFISISKFLFDAKW